jgi:hypothetical protein
MDYLIKGTLASFYIFNPLARTKKATSPIHITLPNRDLISSMHVTSLDTPWLPPAAHIAHILGSLHTSLISVIQLCNSGCEITFKADEVKVSLKGTVVMTGTHYHDSGLWCICLMDQRLSQQSDVPKQVRNSYIRCTKGDLVHYLHASCCSPAKSTWIKAIKAGHFAIWPGIPAEAFSKYLTFTGTTPLDHLDQKCIKTLLHLGPCS